MEPRPTQFGRGRGYQRRAMDTRPVTQAQALDLRNGLWDAQQEVARLRDQIESIVAAIADHDRAITHHDNDIHDLKDMPVRTAADDSVVEPAMSAREEAWEQIVSGVSVYIGQHVTGDELAAVLANAVIDAEFRTGIDAGTQP